MALEAILWDLDGTLADTAPDLGMALNRLLQRHERPMVDVHAVRSVAGHGTRALLQLSDINPEHPDFAWWQAEYLAEYGRINGSHAALFDGINAVLTAIMAQGVLWGIVTNKPTRLTLDLLPKLPWVAPPAVVVCGDTCVQAKPHAAPLLYACAQMGIVPEHCWYVGDGQRDIQAGHNAGMKAFFARWGYWHEDEAPHLWGADGVWDHPLDALALLRNDAA